MATNAKDWLAEAYESAAWLEAYFQDRDWFNSVRCRPGRNGTEPMVLKLIEAGDANVAECMPAIFNGQVPAIEWDGAVNHAPVIHVSDEDGIHQEVAVTYVETLLAMGMVKHSSRPWGVQAWKGNMKLWHTGRASWNEYRAMALVWEAINMMGYLSIFTDAGEILCADGHIISFPEGMG